MVYFAVLHKLDETVDIDAEAFKMPPRTLAELRRQEVTIAEQIQGIDDFYKDNSLIAIDLFSSEIEKLSHEYEFEDANLQSVPEADNNIMILRGWIPKRLENELLDFIMDKNVVHFAVDGTIDDNPPVLLRNNWFAKIFEPIGKMFMLPYYNELDLTPFFAPFYMMFFGFCAGDAGYGIVIFLLGWLLKRKFKSNTSMLPFLTLIQALGVGTFIMGLV
jgi:V/A-type H+-transporting ATPase subunit I